MSITRLGSWPLSDWNAAVLFAATTRHSRRSVVIFIFFFSWLNYSIDFFEASTRKTFFKSRDEKDPPVTGVSQGGDFKYPGCTQGKDHATFSPALTGSWPGNPVRILPNVAILRTAYQHANSKSGSQRLTQRTRLLAVRKVLSFSVSQLRPLWKAKREHYSCCLYASRSLTKLDARWYGYCGPGTPQNVKIGRFSEIIVPSSCPYRFRQIWEFSKV